MELCVDLTQFLGHYNVSYVVSINHFTAIMTTHVVIENVMYCAMMTTHVVMVDVCEKTLTCQYSKSNNCGTGCDIFYKSNFQMAYY